MIQIIDENRRPEKIKPPSMTDRFKNAFATAVDVGSKTYLSEYEKKLTKEKKSKEDQQVKQLTGLDISGIQDPKIRLEAVKEGMKFPRESQNQSIYAKGLRGEELSEQEISQLPINAQTQLHKARNPKELKKTQASQPIDEDQLRRIGEVRQKPDFEKAPPSKKYQMFTDAGVSKENAKAESDIYAEEEKTSLDRLKEESRKNEKLSDQEFKEKVRVHKESEAFDKQVLERGRIAKKTISSVKEAEKILAKGNVKPASAVNVLNLFGEVGKTLATAIQNKDQAAIKALMPEFLEGKKEVFGVRLSDADLKLLQDKSIDIGKSPEANRAILGLIKKYADQSILRSDIALEMSKKNGGYRPLGYERMVDEEFDRQISPVMMIDPKSGMTLSVPAYRVSAAISKGAKVLKEDENE